VRIGKGGGQKSVPSTSSKGRGTAATGKGLLPKNIPGRSEDSERLKSNQSKEGKKKKKLSEKQIDGKKLQKKAEIRLLGKGTGNTDPREEGGWRLIKKVKRKGAAPRGRGGTPQLQGLVKPVFSSHET